jgi:hypothetical protein
MRFWLRWGLYIAGIVAVVIWLAANYYRERTGHKRRFPLLECVTASVAFAGWGLVMPASPLSLSLSRDNRIIWTAIITTGTVFIIGVLGVPLKGKVKK